MSEPRDSHHSAPVGTPTASELAALRGHPFLRGLEWHAEHRSTNDLGLERAQQATCLTPWLILAGRQTQGRGRGAHRWWSSAGALTCSIVLDPASLKLQPQHLPRVALIAGLSVCDVIHERFPTIACQLKWPNDVLIGGRKVCGILVEPARLAAASALPRLVLGLGVNLNNSLHQSPDQIEHTGASLSQVTGTTVALVPFLLRLLTKLDENLALLAAEDARLAARWQALCPLRGRRLTINQAGQRVEGICRGLDETGALLLDTDRRPVRLTGGVIEHIAPPLHANPAVK